MRRRDKVEDTDEVAAGGSVSEFWGSESLPAPGKEAWRLWMGHPGRRRAGPTNCTPTVPFLGSARCGESTRVINRKER